jgi:hypothetical protein
VEGNKIRVELCMVECTTDIIVAWVNLLVRVADLEIPEPNEKVHL